MTTDVYLTSTADRIAAARWAARELLLGRFVAGGSRWIHRVDAKGAIVSQLAKTRRRAA